MTYWGPVAQEAALLSQLTGLNPVTAQAWLLNEGQSDSIATPSNPLNIVVRGGGSGTGTETGKHGPLFTYADWQAGIRAAAHLINSSGHYQVIRDAIKTGDPIKQAQAIEDSPWAGGHYGGAGAKVGNVTAATRRLLGMTGPVPSGSTVTQAPEKRTLTAAPVAHEAGTQPVTASMLSELFTLYRTPARTPEQQDRFAFDFGALVQSLGGGSAAVDAATNALVPAPLPQTPAIARPSVMPAAYVAQVAPQAAYAVPPIIQPVTAPAPAPAAVSGLPAFDPMGLSVILIAVALVAALVLVE